MQCIFFFIISLTQLKMPTWQLITSSKRASVSSTISSRFSIFDEYDSDDHCSETGFSSTGPGSSSSSPSRSSTSSTSSDESSSSDEGENEDWNLFLVDKDEDQNQLRLRRRQYPRPSNPVAFLLYCASPDQDTSISLNFVDEAEEPFVLCSAVSSQSTAQDLVPRVHDEAETDEFREAKKIKRRHAPSIIEHTLESEVP